MRHFAAAAAKKNKGEASADGTPLTHQARKDAAKQHRRDRYESQQARLLRLRTRREGIPDVGKMKREFRGWFDKEVKYHEILESRARRNNEKWRIRVAAMVERLPVITPDVLPWEREYFDLRDYLATYGKEYPEETGFMFAPDKPEDHIVPTDEELLAGLPFTPAPRETEADATGFYQTRDRELKTRVYLAIKSDAEGNRSGPRWTLPSAIVRSDETMLQAAQRAVAECAGKDLELWCPGNAPMTVNYRVYGKNLPEEVKGGFVGEKIFYYRVQHDSGDVDEEQIKAAEDWGWLTRGEIVERVEGERGKHQAKFFHYML